MRPVKLLLLAIIAAVTADHATIIVNATTQPWPHFWSESVGSGHMLLALREDYRNHLRQASGELGFKYVRGHGLLDDDMSVSFGPGINSYVNVDSIIDFLISIDMRPILELSFMPAWLASGDKTICHYKGIITPPTDLELWHNMISELVTHIKDRYGDFAHEFLFEVWNEPGPAPTFWTGTEQDYYDMYNATATAIKNVDPNLRVGGPATDACTAWIADFIEYCHKHNVPYDFVSTHCYSGGNTNVAVVDNVVSGLVGARKLIANDSIPHIVTEWSSNYIQGSGRGPTVGDYHDSPDEAAFLLATMDKIASSLPLPPSVLSWWAFSDVFEEPGFPVANSSFHGGFGLLNVYQVPKPTYRAFQLLHATATQRYGVSVTGDGLCKDSVGAIAARNASNAEQVLVLIYNHRPYNTSATACTVSLDLSDAPIGKLTQQARIDEGHSNPRKAWINMGMPQYPTREQIDEMKASSALVWEPIAQDLQVPRAWRACLAKLIIESCMSYTYLVSTLFT